MEDKKPTTIAICAACQKEFNLTPQVQKVEKELGYKFTHGSCKRHTLDFYKSMGVMSNEELAEKEKSIPEGVLDLKKHPDILKNYQQGIFTPEQLQQSQQPAQAAESLQEKWKRVNKVLGR